MLFFRDLLNSIPVVGHFKGILQFMDGDIKGGNRAFMQATRTVYVLSAVTVGAAGGPAGCIAASIAAGASYDSLIAVITGGQQVSGVAKIFQKPDKISSWVGAGIEIAGDGLSAGIGGSLADIGMDTGKIIAKELTIEGLKLEGRVVTQIVSEIVSEIAVETAIKGVSREITVHVSNTASAIVDAVQTSVSSLSTSQTSNSSSGRQQQPQDDKSQQDGNSGDPGDSRNGWEKKKECHGATIQQLEEFIRIVDEIEELMMLIGEMAADFISINHYLQEFISAAIPLMNDPTVRLTIRGGTLEIVMSNGNLVGISRHLAALLSKAIKTTISNTSRPRQPCSRKSCRFCPNLREVQSGSSGCCETEGAIYSFYCRNCNKIVYAGQTTQPLRNRMTHHLNFEGSPLRRHLENTPGHSNNVNNLLDIFDIVIMWTKDGIDKELLDDASIKRIIRNWEVLMQWLTEAHTSQGGGCHK